MDEATREAVDRLLILAKSDTGQAGRIANFLLAWWNAEELAEVEAGEEIAVTRHGKVIARLMPDYPRKAADAFRDLWADADEIDLVAPEDRPAEAVASLDD